MARSTQLASLRPFCDGNRASAGRRLQSCCRHGPIVAHSSIFFVFHPYFVVQRPLYHPLRLFPQLSLHWLLGVVTPAVQPTDVQIAKATVGNGSPVVGS